MKIMTAFQMIPEGYKIILILLLIWIISMGIIVIYAATNDRNKPISAPTAFFPVINTIAAVVVIFKIIILAINGLINLIKE